MQNTFLIVAQEINEGLLLARLFIGEVEAMNWLLRGDVQVETAYVACTDGILLATDFYTSPHQKAPVPTIIERTPYGRKSPELQSMAEFFVARGYNVVLQDTRGRGDSEGMFMHYISDPHEGEDGVKLLDWVTEQPWSNGSVGTVGLSYTGSNQQSLAVMNHPALKAQVIFDAAINYGQRTVREEGAFVLGQLGTYALRMAISSPQAMRDPVIRAKLEAARECAPEWFRHAPWSKGCSPVSAIPEYEDWLLFAQNTVWADERWNNPQMNIEHHLEKYPDIPVLYLSSWYGHHVWSTMKRLERFQDHVSPKNAIIGTWLHADPYGFSTHTGNVEFGPAASINTNELRLRWFDEHLKGEKNKTDQQTSPIIYFQMGGGSGRRNSEQLLEHGGGWKHSSTWPPEQGEGLLLYLAGGGRLEVDTPASGRESLVTEIARPVPSVGGSIKNPDIIPGFFREGAQDQREWANVLDSPGSNLPLSARQDVVSFATSAFEVPTVITGPLYFDLWVSSTSEACDLSLKVVDEYPSTPKLPGGYSLNIADSYQRFASWTTTIPADVAPRLVTVGPLHISNEFGPGHKFRIDVATSNWPRFDKNTEADQTYTLTIHCGGAHPSRVRGAGVNFVNRKEDHDV